MRQKIESVIMGILCSVGFSACSTYSSTLDCPYGEGLGCASISRVNHMVDAQRINLDEDLCGRTQGPAEKRVFYIYYGPDHTGQHVTIDTSRNTE